MSPSLRRKSRPESVSRTAEWTVAGKAVGLGLGSGRKSAKVKIEDGRVRVTWLEGTSCASRIFSVHGVKELIKLVDGPGHRYHDMWLELKDDGARRFYLRVVEEGQLTANQVPSDHGTVPWDGLKHAFEQALEELDSET